jgi:hypothetical protein
LPYSSLNPIAGLCIQRLSTAFPFQFLMTRLRIDALAQA